MWGMTWRAAPGGPWRRVYYGISLAASVLSAGMPLVATASLSAMCEAGGARGLRHHYAFYHVESPHDRPSYLR